METVAGVGKIESFSVEFLFSAYKMQFTSGICPGLEQQRNKMCLPSRCLSPLYVFALSYRKLLIQVHYSEIPGESEQQVVHSLTHCRL
jgi:hypothetical protein